VIEPAKNPCVRQWESDDEGEAAEADQRYQKLPAKQLQAVMAMASPSFPDVAFLGYHALKQNETHYATDVKKQEKQCNSRENQGDDRCSAPSGVVCEWGGERCVYNTPGRLGVMRRGPIEIAAPAGAYFAGKKSDERQARPLTKAEGLQELLFGVMEGRVDNVNGRDRQGHPAENSCSLPGSPRFRGMERSV
jgi:hypothetical protein